MLLGLRTTSLSHSNVPLVVWTGLYLLFSTFSKGEALDVVPRVPGSVYYSSALVTVCQPQPCKIYESLLSPKIMMFYFLIIYLHVFISHFLSLQDEIVSCFQVSLWREKVRKIFCFCFKESWKSQSLVFKNYTSKKKHPMSLRHMIKYLQLPLLL